MGSTMLGTAIRGCANLIDWLESSGAVPISFTVCHSFRVHIQLFIDVITFIFSTIGAKKFIPQLSETKE